MNVSVAWNALKRRVLAVHPVRQKDEWFGWLDLARQLLIHETEEPTMEPTIETKAFFHQPTFTLTYVVFDPSTRDAVVVDPVLDYDPLASTTSLESARKLVDWIRARELRVHWVLETHAHADHLTASAYLRRELDAKVVIGESIRAVQDVFKPVFGLSSDFPTDGSQFDQLVADGQTLRAGSMPVKVLHTPGHTPACVSYLIGDAVFTGDALFMPDYGTGRCDFPSGSANELFTSISSRLYALPDDTRVFVGHDYQPGGRALAYETTIGASKASNIQLSETTTREQFVAMRAERDANLSAPRLLFPSVQININAGRLPQPDETGIRRLAVPLNLRVPTDDCGEAKHDSER